MEEKGDHAIVFGASGIIGWAVVDQLLKSYPHSDTFSRVTAITNRPINISDSFWPDTSKCGPKLQLVSGIDLDGSDGAGLAESLKRAVPDVESVTHVYYLAGKDDLEEATTNRRMFQNVVDAHSQLSPNLKFVAFPGGTRGYGIYAPGGTFTPPLTEDMVDQLSPDYAKFGVYAYHRQMLNKACAGKKWTWCEVCPDAIIGFTPNGSQFSLSLHWAQYLSLYAYNHGIGSHSEGKNPSNVKIPFPGNAAGATSLFTPASSSTIARFMIYASLNPEKSGGQLFNIADHSKPCTYGELWPRLAEWFGLIGTGPASGQPDGGDKLFKVGELPDNVASITPSEYIRANKHIFEANGCAKAITGGVGSGSQQLDSVGYWLTFDRPMSLEKLRSTGFNQEQDPIDGWLEAFEMFRNAKLIL